MRRMAARRGLTLRKGRGLYAIIDPAHGGAVHAGDATDRTPYSLTLDEGRQWLEDWSWRM